MSKEFRLIAVHPAEYEAINALTLAGWEVKSICAVGGVSDMLWVGLERPTGEQPDQAEPERPTRRKRGQA